MLQRLFFTNFKSWPKADLACGGITGLFGTNSSGKTSILQFLLLLKQTKEATDRLLSLELNGDYVELGTIGDAIHQHDEASLIDMEITFGRDAPLMLSDPATKGATLASDNAFTLATRLVIQQQAARTTQLTYKLGGHEFVLQRRPKGVISNSATGARAIFVSSARQVAHGGFPRQSRVMHFRTRRAPITKTRSSYPTWRLLTKRQSIPSSTLDRYANTQNETIFGRAPGRPMSGNAAKSRSMQFSPRLKMAKR